MSGDSLLKRINARVEPRVRAGFASPGLLPAGLIVLETAGRRSGRTHRTPLFASRAPGGYLWVSTILGRRANWLRNAEANAGVRYWLAGKLHDGRAVVSAPGLPEPDLGILPGSLRGPARRAMAAAQMFGFGVLIIVPAPGGGSPAEPAGPAAPADGQERGRTL
jgi:deazaflavin-dependent oxidoreductase (nitroreductase family)